MPRPSLAVGAVLLVLAAAPSARPCDSNGCFMATRGPKALPAKGRVQLDLTWRRTAENDPFLGSSPTASAVRPWVDFERRTMWPGFHEDLSGTLQVLQVDAAWGIAPLTAVTVSLPISARRDYEVGHGGTRFGYRTRGIGDAVLGARRSVLARGGVEVVAGLAMKLPTGRSDAKSPYDGTIMDPMYQPGTGATDVLLSAQAFARRAVDLSASVSWQRAGTNDRDYRYGNEWIAAIGTSRRVTGPVSASLQLKLNRRGRATFIGQGVAGTGGEAVYVTPGVRVAAGPVTALFAYAPIPVRRRVNETQLGPGRGVLVGVARTF